MHAAGGVVVKRCTNPEAAPMSELESIRRDTDDVNARVRRRVVVDGGEPAGFTPMQMSPQMLARLVADGILQA
ncbi:MAG TPA: hypothetical protein VG755_15800 [Nannocystaceae bacterium]|nr:hypothetical protein [Nannocystaceae bacterium]